MIRIERLDWNLVAIITESSFGSHSTTLKLSSIDGIKQMETNTSSYHA